MYTKKKKKVKENFNIKSSSEIIEQTYPFWGSKKYTERPSTFPYQTFISVPPQE